MAGRRTSRRISGLKDDGFVSADQFDFGAGLSSPKGPTTRRRSSIQLNKAPLPRATKRASMMPTVEEKPTAAAANRRRSAAPVVSKGIPIRNFYKSPEKKVKASRVSNSSRRSTSRNLQELVPSPKKVSKHSFLTEADIAESLEDMFDKTPTDGKKPQKTFETEAPEKVKPRRATIQLKSPIVMVSKDLMKSKTLEKASPVKRAVEKSPVKTSKTPAKTPAKSAKTPAKPSKTPAKTEKTPAKTEKTPAKTAKTPAKVAKTPAKAAKTPAKAAKTPAKSAKTPVVEAKVNLKRKGGETEEVAPSKRARLSTPKVEPAPAAPTRSGSVKKMVAARHILQAKRTPALRKVAAKTISTPVQLNPSNILRKNLKTKVSTAIESKIAQKPNSSPYLLKAQDENSPKFEKVEKREEERTHITGTPAMTRRTRKFGTILQPAPSTLLSQDSPVPLTSTRQVHSSTPVRGRQPALDEVATPIRAPKSQDTPLSPVPEMVTGGLAKLCIIM